MTSMLPSSHRYLPITLFLVTAILALGTYAWHVDHATWEVTVLRWLQDSGLPGLRPMSIGLAVAGSGLPWAMLIGAISLALWVLSGLRATALLIVSAILQDIGAVMKVIVERARPSEGSVEVWRQISSYSFPSGHVLGATLVFGFLFFALEHCALHLGVKRVLQALCVAWVLLMGIGRMMLGAHWPTDVIGGYLLGALLLLPIVAFLRRAAEPTSVA